MPNKDFLENYPLYKDHEAESSRRVDPKTIVASPIGYDQHSVSYLINKPAIKSLCPICKDEQTYNMINDYGKKESFPVENTFRIIYTCMGCMNDTKIFFVYFFEKEILVKNKKENKKRKKEKILYMKKIGQFPAWSIEMDKNLAKILNDKEQKMYKNGLICESQSYGVGAYAYYRRIVEGTIDDLLEKISDLLSEEDKYKYEDALKDMAKSTVASEKIKLVKDMLPQSLKLDGMNPLGALYKALSGGIHEMDDEDCLERAEDIRNVLIFLNKKSVEHKQDKKQFTKSMERLLDKKINKDK